MKRIDIKEIELDELSTMVKKEAILVKENGLDSFLIVDANQYTELVNLVEADQNVHAEPLGVKIVTNAEIELTDEEYEKIKAQLLEALDSTFKRKKERLS